MTNAEPSNFRRCEPLETQLLSWCVQWLSRFISQFSKSSEMQTQFWLSLGFKFFAQQGCNLSITSFFSFNFGRRWNIQFRKWPTTQSPNPPNSHFFVCYLFTNMNGIHYVGCSLFRSIVLPKCLAVIDCLRALECIYISRRLLLFCHLAFMARDLIYEKSCMII